jgi:HEAT repeat protein
LVERQDAGNHAVLEALAESGPSAIRQLAWERILGVEDPATAERAAELIADPEPGIRCVAAARLLLADPADERARAVLRGAVPEDAALSAIEIVRRGRDPSLVPVLAGLADGAEPTVRGVALDAAATLAPEDPTVLSWAHRASADPDPATRRAAFSVLPRLCAEDQIPQVAASGFSDASPEVRRAAVEGLGARGDAAAAAILSQLHDHREVVQLATIDALGLAKGQAAGDLLFGELDRGVFATVPLIRRLARSFPRGHPGWPAMRAALDDARRRTIRLVLHVLDALGHRRTLRLVRLMITSPDQRSRANAIESLASLPQRRFVIPILPLIESSGTTAEPPLHGGNTAKDLLGEALASSDAWLRAAAAVAWRAETGQIPDRLASDPSPIVAETVRALAQRPIDGCRYSQEALMSRLAFLHDVPLFAEAGLDDLIAVDHALGSETYLAGEAIVREGETGDRLCIVYRGEVLVRKEGVTLARLTTGDFFGEMSLFDAEPRSATVTAIGEVEVLALQRDRFHSLVQQRPSILMQLCTTLVRRLRLAEQAIPAATPPVQAAG